MGISATQNIVVRRFPATPDGKEAHGTWRGTVSLTGDVSGGIATLQLASPRQLFLAILGWSFRSASPQEYLVGYPNDETGVPLEGTGGVSTPTFGGVDLASQEGIYVPVAVDSPLAPIISCLSANVDGETILLKSYGLWWDEALQRRLDVVPNVRP